MHALATFCFDPSTKKFTTKTTQKSVGVNDVLIKTTPSGLCYTDVHAKEKGCGLGHEGVGIVQQVGRSVTHLKEDDRVGWGWLHSVRSPIDATTKKKADEDLVMWPLYDMPDWIPPVLRRGARVCLFGSGPRSFQRLPNHRL